MEAHEASEGATISVNKPTGQLPRSPPLPKGSSLVTSNYKPKCVYCDGEHYSASCTKVVTSKDQKAILLKSGRCFNCLKTRHKSRDCDSTRTCRNCHQHHHQSICDCPPTSQDSEPAKNATTNTTTKVSNGKKVVLLQTAQAMAIGESVKLPVKVLLDSGSQLSYITNSLRERLKLKTTRKEKYIW